MVGYLHHDNWQVLFIRASSCNPQRTNLLMHPCMRSNFFIYGPLNYAVFLMSPLDYASSFANTTPKNLTAQIHISANCNN